MKSDQNAAEDVPSNVPTLMEQIISELRELRTEVRLLGAYTRENLVRLYVPVDAEPLVSSQAQATARAEAIYAATSGVST